MRLSSLYCNRKMQLPHAWYKPFWWHASHGLLHQSCVSTWPPPEYCGPSVLFQATWEFTLKTARDPKTSSFMKCCLAQQARAEHSLEARLVPWQSLQTWISSRTVRHSQARQSIWRTACVFMKNPSSWFSQAYVSCEIITTGCTP